MVTDGQPTTDDLLSALFGPKNTVQRSPQLDPWIERLAAGLPTILPARYSGGPLRLYAISPSAADARGFAEELLAAIGPSWSDFEGSATALDPADTVEAALLAHERATDGGPTYRIVVRDRDAAWAAMERLRGAWRVRPAPRDEGLVLVPLPDLLRDVELALQTSAVDEAAWLIDVLRRRGELSSQNLLFLELRLLASSGRWGDILQHPRLDDVMYAHRPVGITSMLFDALDARFLAGAAAAQDAADALRVYRERIAPRFSPLLTFGGEINTTAATQLRMLAAVDEGGTLEETLALCTEASPESRPWLEAIARLAAGPDAEKPEPTEPAVSLDEVQLARDAAYAGDHARVLDLLADAPRTRQAVELLIGAAVSVGSLSSAGIAAAAFNELDDGDQASLRNLPLLAAPLARVLALGTDGQAIRSWAQWLSRLNADTLFEAALDVATLGATEWPATEPATAAEADALAAALTSVSEHSRVTLERGLPQLLAYLDRRPQPDNLSLPIYNAILEVLAYGESRSRAVQEAVVAVLTRVLEGGPTDEVYVEQLAQVEHIWEGVRSPSTLGWLVDVLVALVHYQCPSPSARADLVRRALADALGWHDLDTVDVELLRLLAMDPVFEGLFVGECEALPQPDGPTDNETAVPQLEPGPLTIGIYTLSEPSAHRAKSLLEGRFPSLDIQLNHEHDDSDRLRGLAKRADIMAVVIASAKHAATEAISRNCPRHALLEVGTAGSTGLIRAILGRIEERAAA